MLDTCILIPYNGHVGERQDDVVLHPIRMRVILTLGSGEFTTREIQAAMPDVSQATLYRAINRLLDANRIEVAEHRKRRGATERVYRVTSAHRANSSAVHRDVIALDQETAAALVADMAALVDRAIANSKPGATPYAVSFSVVAQSEPAPDPR